MHFFASRFLIHDVAVISVFSTFFIVLEHREIRSRSLRPSKIVHRQYRRCELKNRANRMAYMYVNNEKFFRPRTQPSHTHMEILIFYFASPHRTFATRRIAYNFACFVATCDFEETWLSCTNADLQSSLRIPHVFALIHVNPMNQSTSRCDSGKLSKV